ncbi:hypothetical protein ACHAXA_007209 [Cyclostephanos tholiformis]|uniref:6,7-dimethyl-8-ribityllumazine synthase n=1 Tax=Cyclostephanos tholiformis TaxID=382380 RepID=A0ABD3SGH2_9STRA
MTIGRTLLLLSAAAISLVAFAKPASAFLASSSSSFSLSFFSGVPSFATKMAAESEVSFSDDLDGSSIRIGVLRTRWNDVHVSNLVEGIKAGVRECKVTEENLFIKEVPGAYELPYAAKLLAMSGTVDAIICCGVLIKGDTLHFEYISSAVTSGIMNVNLATMTPVIYGVLNCIDEDQVRKRSSDLNGGHNHGVDWGKTAVEMAILRREAFAKGTSTPGKVKDMEKLGFGVAPREGVEKTKPGFF